MHDILLILFGAFLGMFVTLIGMLRLKVGTLHIDRHNPEKDQYLFDIENLDNLAKRKIVILKVDSDATLSQE